MIRSMTGFGQAAFEVESLAFEIEIRSVNHRHLDVRARLPKGLAKAEGDIKARVQEALQRGRVDVSVNRVQAAAAEPTLAINEAAVGALVRTARDLGSAHGLDGSLRIAELLALPGVLRLAEREPDPAGLLDAFAAAFTSALVAIDTMRANEGKALEREIRLRLEGVAALLLKVRQRSDGVVEAVRAKLRKRAEMLQQETGLLDEARLHQEVVIAADRLDIVEEGVRLDSHVQQFRTLLDESGPGVAVGRRLDFLLQEMARETNTIGSKGSDTAIAHLVVDLKTELERIREQVQNVE